MNAHPTPKPESRGISDGALVACALWLLTGFIGATMAAAGLLRLFETAATPVPTLIVALCGAVLASTGWLHARSVLDRAERAKVAGRSPAESAGAR